MKVLIGCEYSGIVRNAFTALGHDSWSCDLLDTESPGQHIKGDVLSVLDLGWDLAIFHPPCTFLSKACSYRWKDTTTKIQLAVEFIDILFNSPIPKIAIENPPGWLNHNWKRPNNVIEPYMFGDPWKKQICLWLKNLPPLLPTHVNNYRPFVYHTGGGSMTPDKRHKLRSKFFPGVAHAMAMQWST